MTTTLAPARPESAAGRTTFAALAARETRRFAVNPAFLLAVAMTAWSVWAGRSAPVTGLGTGTGTGTWYPAIFLGGFGMMATFWLTRSMRDSEPVAGVTPTTLPKRTAALCTVAVAPLACGVPPQARSACRARSRRSRPCGGRGRGRVRNPRDI